ncbi:MAG: hypothetical protein WCT31_02345 [Candidatus Micrarchaeia archaeon]|jgi:hypothetical protein
MTFKTRFHSVGVASRDYFKSCGVVMADRLVNGAYGLQLDRLSEKAKRAKLDYPKTEKVVGAISEYGFMFTLAKLGGMLGKITGDTLGYFLVFTHPTIVSLANGFLRLKTGMDELFKPSIRAYITTFALFEIGTTPLAFTILNTVAKLSEKAVSIPVAVLATVAMAAITLPLEYVGFRFIWSRFILKDVPKGTLMDGVRQFVKEVHPSRFFGKTVPENPAKNASEYVGQIFGVMESNWIFVQLKRAIVSGTVVALYSVSPTEFLGVYLEKSAAWATGLFETFAAGKNYRQVKSKMDANNNYLSISQS